eukprot:CAMPEP_0183338196 /NCGR_PEP_ID=MMETSP0164_2-20130417/5578_1 /TAXON_ID=221442 /ORGANISM="Coccolithus pelagicus ssp braarudi, Strain PLY182g" /LENGTH=248 /DNA_ID=CAMNT_0025508011 /DNA_START=15 /DNA_END=758 /DNA_ORIENTATION=+
MSEGLFTCVVVGVTGDGKSTTCNTMVGQEVFDTSVGLESATAECMHHDYLYLGPEVREMRVVDTIGLHDTGLPQETVMERFSTFAELVPCGINLFLFIVRWGRFKPEHEAAFDAFVANCGEAALSNTLLIFTSCALTDEAFAAHIDKVPASLRRLLPKLASAPIGIDSLKNPSAARASIHAAIDEAAAALKGVRYSNEALAEARACYDVKQEDERSAFAAAVADWRKGSGPIVVERESCARSSDTGAA